PSLAVQSAKFADHGQQGVIKSILTQHQGHTVYGIAFGDPAKIQLYRRVLDGAAGGHIQLQCLMSRGRSSLGSTTDGSSIGALSGRAKAPGLHQIPDSRVKSTPGCDD